MLSRRIPSGLTRNALFKPSPVVSPNFPLPASNHAFRTFAPFSLAHSQNGSSASSTRWKARQGKDIFARQAKVQNLKSRAAFKLLELNEQYKIFRRGQTVVDLGFAPGSWSQVAADRTRPGGRIVGIDIIPAQPPEGVSTIQGNFLSPSVQADVRQFLSDAECGRSRSDSLFSSDEGKGPVELTEEEIERRAQGYVDIEKQFGVGHRGTGSKDNGSEQESHTEDKVVDVVLSDMCEPWEQTEGFWKRSLSNPYHRMMNASGMNFRDHAGSMVCYAVSFAFHITDFYEDLCAAALQFCIDALKPGGHFVCKFYQGSEDKAFELRLKTLFAKVYRDKPESSRAVSLAFSSLPL
ncbi:MAG: 2' O-ribose methyltransferase [Vezdaea aestivalis]|nr:MAG: 2' O-ribose methyltransferase [Vezdaea aestivalis]